MEAVTNSQVSKSYSISTRMLRYYEQIGLIESLEKKITPIVCTIKLHSPELSQILILRKHCGIL
jgi:hypothetical protein